MNWFKRRLLNYVLSDVFKCISEYDFVDIELLDKGERREYLWEAKGVAKNLTFQTEMKRLQYVMERRIIKDAKCDFDIIIGKGQLALIEFITKRFEYLKQLHDREQYANDQSA